MSFKIAYYTIEKDKNGYTVWLNKEEHNNNIGCIGLLGIFSSRYKKDCILYCKKHNIKWE